MAAPGRRLARGRRHEHRVTAGEKPAEPGTVLSHFSEGRVIILAADRQTLIQQLGEARRQFGAVLDAFIGECSHDLVSHHLVLRRGQTAIFGGDRQLLDHGARAFERRASRIERRRGRRLGLVPHRGAEKGGTSRRCETATGPLIRRPITLDAGLRRPVTPMTAGTAPRWQTRSDSIEIV